MSDGRATSNRAAILDGFALWQEFKPQSPEDWIRVAERFIEAGLNVNQASPEFRRLVGAVVELRAASVAIEAKCRRIEHGDV